MPELFDPHLVKTYREDKRLLEQTEIPIVTVSATYKEDLKRMHGLPDDDTIPDVVFSRAHYSMALGVATQIWGDRLRPDRAWIVEPTNYVSKKNWFSIEFTQAVGKTIARYSILKTVKDFIDNFGRQKLPILSSITPPLLYLTENIHRPILSFHIAAGNILAEQGKKVVQVITDPHVRTEYVTNADKSNLWFCTFDENTKTEFLEKAAKLGIEAEPDRIIVTGPPVDPRVIAAKTKKNPWRSGPLNLALTTGGLGTNKQEILNLLEQLLPELRKRDPQLRLLVYAGTHRDIYEEAVFLAGRARIAPGKLADKKARFRVLYHPQIVDANEMLIKYGFPWAHGFLSKPSGDMAYDAAASGSFILSLAEWGEWEERIRVIFEQKAISRQADVAHIVSQLAVLRSSQGKSQSWIEQAMLNAHKLDPLFLNGAKEIVKVVKLARKEM